MRLWSAGFRRGSPKHIVLLVLFLRNAWLSAGANGRLEKRKVSSPQELRDAFENPSIDHVILTRSLYLRPHNGWGSESRLNVTGSIVVEVETEFFGRVAVDVDGMMSVGTASRKRGGEVEAIGATETLFFEAPEASVTITFIRVEFVGVVMSLIKNPGPSRISYNFHNCLVRGSTSRIRGEPNIEFFVAEPAHILGNLSHASFSEEQCRNDTHLAKLGVPEGKMSYCQPYWGGTRGYSKWVESYGVKLVDQKAVLNVTDTLVWMELGNDQVVETGEGLWEMLADTTRSHNEVIISGRLSMVGQSLECPITLNRNAIIRGENSTQPPSAMLDFGRMQGCLSLAEGVQLTLRDLIFKNSTPGFNSGTGAKLIPAVVLSPGSKLVLENVVFEGPRGQTAPEMLAELIGKERVENSGMPGLNVQEVESVGPEFCDAQASTPCVTKEECQLFKCPENATLVHDVFFESPVMNGTASCHILGGTVILPPYREEGGNLSPRILIIVIGVFGIMGLVAVVVFQGMRISRLRANAMEAKLNGSNVVLLLDRKIGVGTFGEVVVGLFTDSKGIGRECAVKLVYSEKVSMVEQEIKVFSLLPEHPNIVGFLEGDPTTHNRHRRAYLCTELMHTNLRHLIHEDDVFRRSCTYYVLLCIFADIARGLEILHSHNINHCDLKPRNVLLTRYGRAKLSDFGSSMIRAHDHLQSGAETVCYMAPEAVQGWRNTCTKIEGQKMDIFSFATIMWECLDSLTPSIDIGVEVETSDAIYHMVRFPVSSCIRREVRELVWQCGRRNLHDRPTASEIQETIEKLLVAEWVGERVCTDLTVKR
ncbi:hypothetical protein BSKO_05646 [Bryopsis sp. KO-2023]|nr:hypothetical protein BSKO_05646 [Bryopsis sp. KO-2023]